MIEQAILDGLAIGAFCTFAAGLLYGTIWAVGEIMRGDD